jgi:hypothetical protein
MSMRSLPGTFTQKSTTYKPDGTSGAETWYEAALLPGHQRKQSCRERQGHQHAFGSWLRRLSPGSSSVDQRRQGHDLNKLREDSWEGKPAYVAEKGD